MKRKTPKQRAKANRAILHLRLHRDYFDEIAKGRKKREYRDDKPFWRRRLMGRKYAEILFRNGHLRRAPLMRVKCLGIRKGKGRIVIRLGKILEVTNYIRSP
jgi:hypothetical protein